MERIWIGHECSLVPWNEVNMSQYRAPFQGWQHDSLGMRLGCGYEGSTNAKQIRGSDCTFLLSLLARALAIMVLPVPGGPWNNITIPAPYVMASSSPMRFRQRLYASKLLTVFKISCFCSLGRITYRKHTIRAVIFKDKL